MSERLKRIRERATRQNLTDYWNIVHAVSDREYLLQLVDELETENGLLRQETARAHGATDTITEEDHQTSTGSSPKPDSGGSLPPR